MAKSTSSGLDLNFTFYEHLRAFYLENRGRIRQHYRELSRKYIDFNDPQNATAFLWLPQFEALEMYVFLKEFLDNEPVYNLFRDWSEKKGKFEGRRDIALLEELNKDNYEAIFKHMKKQARLYPNYIFALTMGTGKTILMATCIFYEFILANKFPKDKKYCHNALVFAPDRTVLQSLKEIQTFDMAKVVPPEYVNFLTQHIQFHFLEEAGTSLNTLDRSRFNLIISNTQKIILKKQHKNKTGVDKLFGSGRPTFEARSVYADAADLYDFDKPENEADLSTNQRFEKLRRLEQLGIYIDEAHHAFGKNLAKDTGSLKDSRKTSLRNTVDILAKELETAGTHIVSCYNYTGTPYVGKEVLPEVVYAYGLQEAINKEFLKKVTLHGYTATRDTEFVSLVIQNFLQETQGIKAEGMLPKLAFFAATIDELQQQLRPAVEAELAKHGIPSSRILVNVGDPKLTTNDQIREFNRLDTLQSEKQFILLVNKGREGWNCRSLFGVGLFRQPKSRIFVLQATMRCLRRIGDVQHTGQVYLSKDNLQILEDELQLNFRISADEFQGSGSGKERVEIRVVPPPKKIKLKRIHRKFKAVEKQIADSIDFQLSQADTEKYQVIHTQLDGLPVDDHNPNKKTVEDVSYIRDQREFSELTMVAEISRYLNKPPLLIQSVLVNSKQGVDRLLKAINEHNELLDDWIIPRLFQAFYEITPDQETEEYEIDLVKVPEKGYYEMSAKHELIERLPKNEVRDSGAFAQSFHVDTYCFDSKPEKELFWRLIRDRRVKELYFTGMLTHGQSDFFVQYIDPESHTVRNYYPDFLVKKDDGSYLIVEVKGENKLEDPVVLAKKDFAEQMAVASGMDYQIIGGMDVSTDAYHELFSVGGNVASNSRETLPKDS